MHCRNVIAVILAAGLLAGCQTWQEVQVDLGMYPVDPPRPETPLPPPGTVSQANWAAQRASMNQYTHQGNTAPVGYQEPEKKAPADPAAAATEQKPATAPQFTPPPGAPSRQPTAVRPASPAPAAASTAPAAPTVVATAPALPRGYRPSPAAADDPKAMAAAVAAPGMAGSMKDAAVATGWRAHLASHRTESAAINEWQELLKANPSLYGQFDPQVEWVDTPQRGSFARLLLVGFADRKDADAACARIRSSTRYCASVKE